MQSLAVSLTAHVGWQIDRGGWLKKKKNPTKISGNVETFCRILWATLKGNPDLLSLRGISSCHFICKCFALISRNLWNVLSWLKMLIKKIKYFMFLATSLEKNWVTHIFAFFILFFSRNYSFRRLFKEQKRSIEINESEMSYNLHFPSPNI